MYHSLIAMCLTRHYVDPEAYELSGNQFAVYGFQYKPGFDDAVSALLISCELFLTIHSTLVGSPTPSLSGRSSNLE